MNLSFQQTLDGHFLRSERQTNDNLQTRLKDQAIIKTHRSENNPRNTTTGC